MKERASFFSVVLGIIILASFAVTSCTTTSNTSQSKKFTKCKKAKAGSACWSNRGAFYTW